jgi:cyanophycinase-like exopeptidase
LILPHHYTLEYFISNLISTIVSIEYNNGYERVDYFMINGTGIVALLGSGETSAAGGLVFEAVARRLADRPQIGILETPAGFELNTHRVAGRVAEYLNVRLQNFQPQVRLIPARKRHTAFSTDDPDICASILTSNVIFFGPGSPSYTVRQLAGSLAWDYIQARHRLGASLALASAATIALGVKALPVYEIYKVGEDPHWKDGLDFFRPFGLSLVVVPHWNNAEGGTEVDTSRCFVGQSRFDPLAAQLDPSITILGLDEHTGLLIDFDGEECQVIGKGEIHLVKAGVDQAFTSETSFSIQALGNYQPLADKGQGIDPVNWQTVLEASLAPKKENPTPMPPLAVMELLEQRRLARLGKEWRKSDELRDRIQEIGWKVIDTPEGQKLQWPET